MLWSHGCSNYTPKKSIKIANTHFILEDDYCCVCGGEEKKKVIHFMDIYRAEIDICKDCIIKMIGIFA